MRLSNVAWLAVCAIAAVGITAPAMNSQALAAGDPAAKTEIIAAFQKLNALRSFKIKWTTPEGSGIADFIQPDKRHFTGRGPQGGVEIFQIGTESRVRYDVPGAPSGWQCTTSRTPPKWLDTGKMRKNWDVQVGRLPDTVIDGMPVHGYTDLKNGDELYIGAQNGLPRRAVDKAKGDTADFFDYGVPISFNPPSCG